MADIMDLFKTSIAVMIFYSFAISTLTYALPSDTLNHVALFEDFSNFGGSIDMNETAGILQENLQAQSDIPVIELGALVFYSGNYLIDLLMNFAFAVPAMVTLLVKGVFWIIGIDPQILVQFQLFLSTIILAIYLIGIIQLVTGVRSGRVI